MMDLAAYAMGAACLAGGAVVLARSRAAGAPTLAAESIPPGWLPVLPAQEVARHAGVGSLAASIRTHTGLAPANYRRDYGQTIERFLDYVQLLPASEAHHHAHPGGLAAHALEAALIALTLRRAQVLPPGCAPEDIQRRAHRWTFGVFVAALLHDVGKPLADMRVTMAKTRGEGPWSPLAGSMAECGGLRYRVEFSPSSYEVHQKLGVFLLQRIVPQATLAWLAEDAELLAQITAFLSGEDKENALARLAVEADRESVRRNLLEGPRTRFATARAVPLIERLMEALRRMLIEGGNLPLNRPGAAGFVAEGSVWFVSKRLADEVREYLARHESGAGVPGPEKNDRLFDTWQEYGACVPNPKTGGAIWRARVLAEGFDQRFTLLRFPLEKLFADPARYPPDFAGQVMPDVEEGEIDLGTGAGAASAAHPPGVRSADTPTGTEIPSNDPAPNAPVVAQLPAMKPRASGIAASPEEEYLDEEYDTTPDADAQAAETGGGDRPAAPAPGRIAPMRLPDKPAPPKPPAAPKPPSSAAMRFMAWVQQGLADGSIAYNETGAMVHFVPEGMFLASPRIFRHFAERFGETGDGQPSTLADEKLGTGIQREVIRAGWHALGPKKTNIHKYQVIRRNGKGGSLLAGLLIPRPERFVTPAPPINPHLARFDKELGE